MSEFVNKVLKELRARQRELKPLAQEHTEVESAINALEQIDGLAGSTRRGRRRSPKSARGHRGKTRA